MFKVSAKKMMLLHTSNIFSQSGIHGRALRCALLEILFLEEVRRKVQIKSNLQQQKHKGKVLEI